MLKPGTIPTARVARARLQTALDNIEDAAEITEGMIDQHAPAAGGDSRGHFEAYEDLRRAADAMQKAVNALRSARTDLENLR